MQLLKVNNLQKTFKNGDIENKVLKGISFTVEQGEFIAVMGQSGSGKSTLLYNISGMDHMTAGTVVLDGSELSKKDDEALAHFRLNKMGFVFQNNYLLKNLSLIDNICLPGFKAKLKKRKDVIGQAESLMKELGIYEVKDHPINKVSGGQLQRGAVCRSLINNPKILFADEPTGALNSRSSGEVLDILNALNQKGMTILTVTHDPKVASVTDRIIYLSDGKIEAELQLGKYSDTNNKRAREEKTLNWLIERGF